MKKSEKGFTLVELLITIILLGIVGTVVVYNMVGVSRNTKEEEYRRFVAAVKSAASVYADNNPEAFDSLYENKSFVYVEVQDLIDDGTLDENLINPYTEQKIDPDDLIKGNLDNQSGSVVFEYPVLNKEDETFLVALDDWVVWGEGYDCMQGAGTYQLALSEEDGTLVMLNDAATVKQYEFECSLPSNFDAERAGNYEIEYHWLTSSNTRKSGTRTLRVLGRVRPSFKTNHEYVFGNWFRPKYDEVTKTWDYLTYRAVIEGGDEENTTFKITKQSNNPIGPIEEVTNGYTNVYETYPVDDGDKIYTIETVVKGHYRKDYSYVAKGEEIMRSKLIIPESFITGAGNLWTVQRQYSITDTYSPVGLDKYEFRLSNSMTAPADDSPVATVNVFDRTENVTVKDIRILDGECTATKREYIYVFFRAINDDGYVGDWTPALDVYLTNDLDLLIKTDSNGCTSCESCCLPSSGAKCNYCDKTKYFRFGTTDFLILEREGDGGILATLDGVGPNRVTPTQLKKARWEIQTCNGLFSKNYEFSSPVIDVLYDEAARLLLNIPNYTNFLRYQTWSNGYTSYVGVVSRNEFTKYGKALHESVPYWTTDTYEQDFEIFVDTPYAHGNSTTKYSTYFYAINGEEISQAYAGSNAYVKPLLMFKNLYVCSGIGTKADPYVVATK